MLGAIWLCEYPDLTGFLEHVPHRSAVLVSSVRETDCELLIYMKVHLSLSLLFFFSLFLCVDIRTYIRNHQCVYRVRIHSRSMRLVNGRTNDLERTNYFNILVCRPIERNIIEQNSQRLLLFQKSQYGCTLFFLIYIFTSRTEHRKIV